MTMAAIFENMQHSCRSNLTATTTLLSQLEIRQNALCWTCWFTVQNNMWSTPFQWPEKVCIVIAML